MMVMMLTMLVINAGSVVGNDAGNDDGDDADNDVGGNADWFTFTVYSLQGSSLTFDITCHCGK